MTGAKKVSWSRSGEDRSHSGARSSTFLLLFEDSSSAAVSGTTRGTVKRERAATALVRFCGS